MKFTESFQGDISVYALTTEGTTERYVLKGLAEKYNGNEKILYFPHLPFAIIPTKRYSIFNGILQTLEHPKIWKEKRVKRYIIITDRDKWCSEKEVRRGICKGKSLKNEVEKHINKVGMRNISIQECTYKYGVTYVIGGTIGGHAVEIFLCISGENKDIDENLSYLYYLKFGEKVDPEWKIIKSCLKKKNINIVDFIKSTSEKYLIKSFPHIVNPIKNIDC